MMSTHENFLRSCAFPALADDPGHPHVFARFIKEALTQVDLPVPDDIRRQLQRYSKNCSKATIIAHGLEPLYVEPEAKPKKTRGRKGAA